MASRTYTIFNRALIDAYPIQQWDERDKNKYQHHVTDMNSILIPPLLSLPPSPSRVCERVSECECECVCVSCIMQF